MEQVAPAANTVPHWFWSVREASPCMEIPKIPIEAPLVLVTVTVWEGLSPMVYPLKVSGDGDRVKTPGNEPFEPVPVSCTVCAPVERLIVSLPVSVTVAIGGVVAIGVKVTVTVQVPLGARVDGQVVALAKSPVTITPLFETETAVVPLLAMVTT